MSDTVTTLVPPNEWTEVAVGAVTVNCTGDKDFYYAYGATQPGVDVIGHYRFARWDLTTPLLAGESLWVRIPDNSLRLSITEDV